MIDNLIQHLNVNGKTDSWLNLANQFNILPGASNKQKSDKVRKVYNRYSNLDPIVEPIRTYPELTIQNKWQKEFEEFLIYKQNQKLREVNAKIEPYLKGDPNNVLVIPDLHLPFELSDALQFCRHQQEKYNCGTVVFIGDILDSHAQSFHHTDPDGLSAKDELNLAIAKLEAWYYTFPKATVLLGNHDRIAARKLFSVGVSQRWLKPFGEVLNTPNWNFVEEFYFDGVLYLHGEGGSANKKAMSEMTSVVQGHLHTEGYVQHFSGYGGNRFAMQVGTLIDFDTYAFAYAQRGKKPILSCGVVLNNMPILIPYGS